MDENISITDTDILVELLEQSLPYLEKQLSQDSKPELKHVVERITAYLNYHYGDFS
jgi:hypothetical protein